MPPRTRGVKAPRASKENNNIFNTNKLKTAAKGTKPARKPLADKTNSASDENASPEPLKKVIQKSTKSSRNVVPAVIDEERPRRNRRLPTRYVENQVLNNLSNSKECAITPSKSDAKTKTPVKDSSKVESPFKTPNNKDNSLLGNRPQRVSRLPSKFDEPCHTSTPLVHKTKDGPKNDLKKSGKKEQVLPESQISKEVTPQKATLQKEAQKKVQPKKAISQKAKQQKASPQKTKLTQTKLVQKKLTDVVKNNTNTDNGVPRARRLRKPVKYKDVTLSPKLKSPENNDGKKIFKANSSFRILEEKKADKGDNLDVYEFTFDPSQEPPPQKKKKKVTNRKPAKPKMRVYNNNYEKNLARALADLKNGFKKKSDHVVPSNVSKPDNPVTNNAEQEATANQPTVPNPSSAVIICTTAEIHSNPDMNNTVKSNIAYKSHASIRVEDIAADFEVSKDLNYSPVNSPDRIDIEPNYEGHVSPERDGIISNDPLNLRNDLSFFDEQPAASSSMNMSTRNPNATPWRVEFENLPIKWQANTYVKPDMTPALESSYVNHFDNSKKKHVYTDMVAQDEVMPEIVDNEQPKLKQTSIISFIKEVIERSASKKKKGAAGTPVKANSLFDDPNTSANTVVETPSKDTSGSSKENTSAESAKTKKRKQDVDINPTPAKVSRKDKENTLFGFDDSENQEQENVSPVKIVNNNRLRSLRSRSGAVLKELNKQTGPMRAELPAAMKSKLAPSSDAVEKIYDQMKSAADAPVLPGQQRDEVEATNVADMPTDGTCLDDDSQSVHLFEDIELVHHLKPTRKSYGKSKKVTFHQHSSDSAEDDGPARNLSSDEDDLSFHLPEVKAQKAARKKKTKKQLLSKKEKAEVDAWAACFNSMCEDIEEFDLVVE